MSGQIYLLNDEASLVEMIETPYDSEALLQELLARYPNLLAGEQMDADDPRRWILIQREAGVPGEEGGNSRWALDHLFVDQDGIPTLVEVKRSTDTRIRREVVGQMLDYASNSVNYWKVDEIRAAFETRCRDEGDDPDDRLLEFLETETETAAFWDLVKTNLQAGKIRMVFVADLVPLELRSIVEFLNQQMDPAEVLAVEIKQYVNGNQKTLVPKVIGQSVKAQARKTSGRVARRTISEQDYLQEFRNSNAPKQRTDFHEELVKWVKKHSGQLEFKQGERDTSFLPRIEVGGRAYFPISCKHSGRLELQMRSLSKYGSLSIPAVRRTLQSRLEMIPGFQLRGGMQGLPYINVDDLKTDDDRKTVIGVLDWLVEQLTAQEDGEST